MAANMKAVKLRMKSVKTTMQIIKAMELVASSKLRKAKERAETCRPYFQELHQTLKDIAAGNMDFSSVYAKAASGKKTCYILAGGDRGLAGGYNANLFRCLEADCAWKEFVVLPIGKRAVEYVHRKGYECLTDEFDEVADISVADCFEIADMLCHEFRQEKFDRIDICYTTFVSMLAQQPGIIPALPIMDLKETSVTDLKGSAQQMKSVRNLILYEPDAAQVFDAIVPEYLGGLIYGSICESVASELAARRTAMEAATGNAEKMIEQLNLHYNRARQASITQEITEIVAGAEGI